MRMASDEAAILVKKFYQLQEERVQTYKLFDQGHQAYLNGAPHYNFPMYRQLVHEITQSFKKISDEVVDIEKKLATEHSLPEVAKFINKVQDDERKKLEITARLQLARQNVVDHAEVGHQEEAEDLKMQMREVVERINEHLDELKYESEDLLRL